MNIDNIDQHAVLTFCVMFLASIMQNIVDNLETLPFAILQAILLGIISVVTRNLTTTFIKWWKKRKNNETD